MPQFGTKCFTNVMWQFLLVILFSKVPSYRTGKVARYLGEQLRLQALFFTLQCSLRIGMSSEEGRKARGFAPLGSRPSRTPTPPAVSEKPCLARSGRQHSLDVIFDPDRSRADTWSVNHRTTGGPAISHSYLYRPRVWTEGGGRIY